MQDAQDYLKTDGVKIIKFSAEWCGPCKKIAPLIHELVPKLPSHVKFMELDIDETIEWYLFLKNKRIIHGIPSIVVYCSGNTNVLAPDQVYVGTDKNSIVNLFRFAALSNPNP